MFVFVHAINYLTTDDDSTKVPVFSSRALLTCNRKVTARLFKLPYKDRRRYSGVGLRNFEVEILQNI